MVATEKLRAFEAAVIEAQGCHVHFDRLVPVEDETQEESKDKKKAPAKAAPKKAAKGGADAEEAKPTHCRGWFDLTPLMHPGVKTITQRISLSQIDAKEAAYPYNKTVSSENAAAVGATSSMDQLTVDDASKVDSAGQDDPFEATSTYAYVTLTLSEPIYPVPDTNIIKDNGASLLAKFGASPEFPSSLDAVKDFDMAVCFIVD